MSADMWELATGLLAALLAAFAGTAYYQRLGWKQRMVLKIVSAAVGHAEASAQQHRKANVEAGTSGALTYKQAGEVKSEAKRVAIEHAAELDKTTPWHFPKVAKELMTDTAALGKHIEVEVVRRKLTRKVDFKGQPVRE